MEISGRPEGQALAAGIAAGLERLGRLFRSISTADGVSPTTAATLATLERSGPCRLTSLAVREGVTQPAMTQLIARLEESGLADRTADPSTGVSGSGSRSRATMTASAEPEPGDDDGTGARVDRSRATTTQDTMIGVRR